ncbi:MAG: hypothetical protein JRI23_20350 [Deltaproteobacteria bacterium]|jgi:hypothetical protein|nr:hypothetical protein [Deltaproteobacteria bacterium]MBW2534238.1 hypothetical protein [Deltaproteobacteria bacterium]
MASLPDRGRADRSPAAELERGTWAALDDDAEGSSDEGQEGSEPAPWGIAAVDVVLRAEPRADARAVAEVGRGQMVVVARSLEGWLLVGHRGSEGLALGWVPQGRVLVPRQVAE